MLFPFWRGKSLLFYEKGVVFSTAMVASLSILNFLQLSFFFYFQKISIKGYENAAITRTKPIYLNFTQNTFKILVVDAIFIFAVHIVTSN